MNDQPNTTTEIKKPARPTDAKIVEALFEVDCDLTDLRRATLVLDEYLTKELRAAQTTREQSLFPYALTRSQADGISYMAMHVRQLAAELEKTFDKALGREAVQ